MIGSQPAGEDGEIWSPAGSIVTACGVAPRTFTCTERGRVRGTMIKTRVAAAALLASVAFAGLSAAGVRFVPKYGVKVSVNKRTDFGRIRTYAWTSGWDAEDPALDRCITAAVERELTGIGLARLDEHSSDVVVRYASLHRADISMKSRKLVNGLRPEYLVGTLVVQLLDAHTRVELFRGRADVPLESEPQKREAQVDGIVTAMFKQYPTRRLNER
jgi:hypothetical protein